MSAGDLRYPLHWPIGQPRTAPHDRQRARYGTKLKDGWGINPLTVAQAMKRLNTEVRLWTRVGQDWRIDPDNVVVSSNLALRLDGQPRSGQKEPDDPGVAVYFTLDGEPLSIGADHWDKVADNIAAIAKWLRTQHDAELTHVGTTKQTFKGYRALPATTTGKSWYAALGLAQMPDSVDELRRIYRALAQSKHPDVGGNRAEWDALIAAYRQGLDALGGMNNTTGHPNH